MKKWLLIILLFTSQAYAGSLTVSSYNCGGLSDNYDYIRAACMQKLMAQRYQEEPDLMSTAEKMQRASLHIFVANGAGFWPRGIEDLISPPTQENSPNRKWWLLSQEMLSNYDVRPVELYDQEVQQMLLNHMKSLSVEGDFQQMLTTGRKIMAANIFKNHLQHDIICLQETDYIEPSLFPDNYEVVFINSNGIAWQKDRYDLLKVIDDIHNKAFAVVLFDKTEWKTVAVATAHLTGCDPFCNPLRAILLNQFKDKTKGGSELKALCAALDNIQVDLKIIAMDANVTAMHPRLSILTDYAYKIYAPLVNLKQTCTNPYQLLDTRIDWIAVKSEGETQIWDIDVPGVKLNDITTNISDHKPIAAKIYHYAKH